MESDAAPGRGRSPVPERRTRAVTEREPDTRETREDEGPPDRASRLAEAILEISASLDVDTVVCAGSWKRPAA